MATEQQEGNGWVEHQAAQQRAWLELTPLQRLRWLDDAKRFAAKYGTKYGSLRTERKDPETLWIPRPRVESPAGFERSLCILGRASLSALL